MCFFLLIWQSIENLVSYRNVNVCHVVILFALVENRFSS